MSTDEPNDNGGWLTIAEIADELHLTPAAIRLWISKGMLPAKRAGMRKLLVHRLDLDWMLREREAIKARRHVESLESPIDRPPELSAAHRVKTARAGEHATSPDMVGFALNALSEADEDLAAARAASENAPPDPDFAHRVRNLAYAFMEQSDALSRAANMGFSWTPAPPPHVNSRSHMSCGQAAIDPARLPCGQHSIVPSTKWPLPGQAPTWVPSPSRPNISRTGCTPSLMPSANDTRSGANDLSDGVRQPVREVCNRADCDADHHNPPSAPPGQGSWTATVLFVAAD